MTENNTDPSSRTIESALESLRTEPSTEEQQRLESALRQAAKRGVRQEPSVRRDSTNRWLRLQFSLRTVLALMVLACVPMYLVLRPYLRQQIAAEKIESLGGRVVVAAGEPIWFQERFGSGIMKNVVTIDIAGSDEPEEYMPEILCCSELEVLAVGGDAFTDQHLAMLVSLEKLKGLVLDTTSVTPAGLKQLKEVQPSLAIRQSWRRVENELGDAATFQVGTYSSDNLDLTVSFEIPPSPYAGPEWLRKRTSDEYFKDLIFVSLTESATDAHLPLLSRLDYQALTLNGSQISDRGMAMLDVLSSGQITLNYSKHESQFTGHGLMAMMRTAGTRFSVSLYGVSLGDDDLSFLDGKPTLKYLVLSDAGLSDDQMPAVAKATSLRELTLNGNPLTDRGLQHLQPLSGLRRLWAFNTEITQAGVDDFRKKRPLCKVIWGEPKQPKVAN